MLQHILTWWRRRKNRQTRQTLNNAVGFLRGFDALMLKAGISRQERRALWRSMANSSDDREKVLTKLSTRLG